MLVDRQLDRPARLRLWHTDLGRAKQSIIEGITLGACLQELNRMMDDPTARQPVWYEIRCDDRVLKPVDINLIFARSGLSL